MTVLVSDLSDCEHFAQWPTIEPMSQLAKNHKYLLRVFLFELQNQTFVSAQPFTGIIIYFSHYEGASLRTHMVCFSKYPMTVLTTLYPADPTFKSRWILTPFLYSWAVLVVAKSVTYEGLHSSFQYWVLASQPPLPRRQPSLHRPILLLSCHPPSSPSILPRHLQLPQHQVHFTWPDYLQDAYLSKVLQCTNIWDFCLLRTYKFLKPS